MLLFVQPLVSPIVYLTAAVVLLLLLLLLGRPVATAGSTSWACSTPPTARADRR
jgi:hypothetical protein